MNTLLLIALDQSEFSAMSRNVVQARDGYTWISKIVSSWRVTV